MKRFISAILVVIFGVSLIVATGTFAANTNNFQIRSYDASYELSRDSDGRSVLQTTETITAEFPSYDQNHGLERAIPTRYNGHPISLTIKNVTNADGTALNYSKTEEGGVVLLRIGDADTYVHGSQTYRISYTQRDVTREYADTARNEWYWDLNGTEWKAPINTYAASIKISDDVASALEGEPYCYQGVEGSSDSCVITKNEDGYTVAASNLRAGENITVAFGFTTGTFKDYEMPLAQKLVIAWGILQALTGMVALVLIIVLITMGVGRHNRTKETNPIVAEYIPPKEISVLVAAKIAPERVRSVFSAQLIDLAVRHIIAIIETREKSTWKPAEYDLEILTDITALREEEQEVLKDMLGRTPAVGERISLAALRKDTTYVGRTTDNPKKLKTLVNDVYKLREKVPATEKYFNRWAIGLLIASILTLSIFLAFAALTAFITGKVVRPLTDEGLRLRRYVYGLDKYIKASEVERLKFLQGPDTAEKVGYKLDTNDMGQLVKLYERTLPYAVLFGREKQWAEQLGEFYMKGESRPDWYQGQTVFNAALFSASLSSFSQASVQASGYSSGSSSSTGGSGGGGFSGGGGGGGGGGGW